MQPKKVFSVHTSSILLPAWWVLVLFGLHFTSRPFKNSHTNLLIKWVGSHSGWLVPEMLKNATEEAKLLYQCWLVIAFGQ
jgi:hypothetical protein